MQPTNIYLFLAPITLWSGLTLAAFGADVKIIANPQIRASSISVEDLRGIFLETKTSLPDGSHVEPAILQPGSVHHAFVTQFMGKTDAALETYYRSLAFSGRGLIPKTLGSDEEMIRYVANTKGAIGYVSANAPTAGVKTVQVK